MKALPVPKKDDLFFLPLGGTGEIGMNLNLYGYEGKWLIVDCGVTFRDENIPGVDIIMPDIHALKGHEDKISGILLTHAHEDHFGAVHYLWRFLKCPIYATPFTAYLLRNRLSEFNLDQEAEIIEISLSGSYEIGPFKIELVNITHSILEPNAVIITTEIGKILHTGDWKIDESPVIGELTNEKRLKKLGKEKVLAIVCDSTNSIIEGSSGSESSIISGLKDSISSCKGRVYVTTFASNVGRLKTITDLAYETGRKVALLGRSMWKMTEAARSVGYLNEYPSFLNEKQIKSVDPEKTLIICTGSQGEPRAGLSRLVSGKHPAVKLSSYDRVIFSSRIIPGNERAIFSMINKLTDLGVEVVTPTNSNIHVSGHPAREELRKMYDWVKPKIAIPVHGEARHLLAHAKLAKEIGVPEIIEARNGTLVKLSRKFSGIVEKIYTGRLAYDGIDVVPIDSDFFKIRKKISYNGIVSVSLIISNQGKLLTCPRVLSLGVVSDVKGDFPEERVALEIKEIFEANIKIENKNILTSMITKKVKSFFSIEYSKYPHVIVDLLNV